jgi:LmbE family N-acetylglucosaminyl deacetylase
MNLLRMQENASLRCQMTEAKRLLCVFAHPDDETLGAGSTLATYAAADVEIYLVTATRGERGWQGDPSANPGLQALGEIRTAELLAAAQVLGIRDVQFLNYLDGDLDQADPVEAIGRIASHIRRIQPQVVITFGPEGSYGHPDHIAISHLAVHQRCGRVCGGCHVRRSAGVAGAPGRQALLHGRFALGG